MKQKEYHIDGMNCSSCTVHVEQSVKDIPGIKNIQVNLLKNLLSFSYDESITQIDDDMIISKVDSAGYKAVVEGSSNKENSYQKEYEKEKKKKTKQLILSISYSLPLMYIAMSDMLHLPFFTLFKGDVGTFYFASLQMILALCVIYINRATVYSGFRTLLKRKPTMDSLIALGAMAAFVYGIINIMSLIVPLYIQDSARIMSLRHTLYFESAAMILTLVLVGKYLEFLAKGRTSEAIERLLNLTPETAVVIRDGKEMIIPSTEVVVGETIIVRPGARFPVDGIIVKGSCAIDASSLTGESLPVEKDIGDEVFATTVNTNGYAEVEATKVGSKTTFSNIIKLVEQASVSKAPIAHVADTISSYFVPIVISISVITTLIWFFITGSFPFSLSFGIATLVISCPCALGLATPTAIMVGIGKLSELGILVRHSRAIQSLHKVDTIIFDKTGTITSGTLSVKEIITPDITHRDKIISKIYSLEKRSEHPIAKAIVMWAQNNDIVEREVTESETLQGNGLKGMIDGELIFGGSDIYLTSQGISIPQDSIQKQRDGNIVVHFGQNNQYLASIIISDTIKASSKDAIKKLQSKGYEVILLTGDAKETADVVAKSVGISSVYSRVLPDGKEKIIRELQEEGKIVAFVGDGINDAPSLMRSDVGIAIHGASDIAIESGEIVLLNENVMDVYNAIEMSLRIMRVIKQNLFWALFYNVIGIPLASGLLYSSYSLSLSPMFAAFAMSISSLFVVTNALRLKNYRYKTHKEDTPMYSKEIMIEGMMCNHCVNHVKKALESIDGVTAIVELDKNKATITSSNQVSDEVITHNIKEAGYTVLTIK